MERESRTIKRTWEEREERCDVERNEGWMDGQWPQK